MPGRQERAPSPELLTRDHVARCIVREIKEGRGSPHGGVFLDIAWIKKRLPNAEEHIKQKLPSMYHQFMKLADIDITKVPMEVGPTTHYMMGGIRVDGDSQMSSVPGLFAAGEAAAGLHGANRLGGNSLSDLLVFGKRAGEYAAKFAKENGAVTIDQEQIEELGRRALAPFETPSGNAESPYQIQKELQGPCRSWSESCGEKRRWSAPLRSRQIQGAGEKRPGGRQPDVQRRMAYRDRPAQPADGFRGSHPFGPDRKESRGAHFRDDYPNKDAALGGFNVILRKTPEAYAGVDGAAAGDAGRTETDNRGNKSERDYCDVQNLARQRRGRAVP